MKKIKSYESIVDLIILIGIFAFLVGYFKPKLILADTHISGGDTGSFNYMLYYLRDYLLPNGKLMGWSPGWFGGVPMFQFYFPLPFAFATFLSWLVPLNVAFKLVTILGIFLLPIAAYFSAKFMKLDFPAPIIVAILSLLFLFNEGNSMWGGNIPSTLAGEFCYSISLALTVLFLGSVYRGVAEKKFLGLNIVLLALIGLTHVYTLLFAVFAPLFMLFSKRDFVKNLKYVSKLYLLSALLVSFWYIPALAKLEYRTPVDYVWSIKNLGEVFPPIMLPTLILAIIGVCFGITKKEQISLYFMFVLLIPLLLYTLAKPLRLVDIRFVPFFQVFLVFPAARAIEQVTRKVKASWLIAIIIFILALFWIRSNITYIPYWIEWNYSGFESKEGYSQFNAINSYLASMPAGRVVHEYSSKHDKFGTPRAFESIPLFAQKPVLEGLLIESSVTAPFVFWIQSEISETPTCPLPWMRCSMFSVENATEHLKLFNVDYVVATSEKLKSALRSNPQYQLLNSFNEIQIYRLNNSGKYVEQLKNEPVLVKTKNWRIFSLEWFKNIGLLDVPLVFSQEDDVRFKIIITDDDLTKIRKIPIEANCTIEEVVRNEEILIKTSCIDVPLLVKIPYFPNWQVEGADKVYLASPAFMLVFPKQENVRLYYRKLLIDVIGEAFSVIGLLIIVLYFSCHKFSKFLNSI